MINSKSAHEREKDCTMTPDTPMDCPKPEMPAEIKQTFEKLFSYLDLGSIGGKNYTSKRTNAAWKGFQAGWNVREVPPDEPRPAQPAGGVGVDAIIDALKVDGDRAYCNALQIAEENCRGAQYKLENGKFGNDDLKWHCQHHEMIGQHRGMYHAINLLRSLQPAPPQADTPIKGAGEEVMRREIIDEINTDAGNSFWDSVNGPKPKREDVSGEEMEPPTEEWIDARNRGAEILNKYITPEVAQTKYRGTFDIADEVFTAMQPPTPAPIDAEVREALNWINCDEAVARDALEKTGSKLPQARVRIYETIRAALKKGGYG